MISGDFIFGRCVSFPLCCQEASRDVRKAFELKIPWGRPRAGSSSAPSMLNYEWVMQKHDLLTIETNGVLVH